MRTFTLGGHTFTAPDAIGAGIVQRYQTGLRKAFLADHPDCVGVDTPEKQATFEAWLSEWAMTAENTVLILATTLTAPDGAPSFALLYDGLQDASEAAAVVDFFSQGVERVMNGPSTSPSRSAATKASPTKRRKR